MTASHYTVHSTEEMKTRHACTKFFLPRDIVWLKNTESIRNYLTCAKEKISVLWRLLMLSLVKRTMPFALMSISTLELSTAAYSTLKLCRWVDFFNNKATYHFLLVRIPSMKKKQWVLSFPQIYFLHWWRGLEATSWREDVYAEATAVDANRSKCHVGAHPGHRWRLLFNALYILANNARMNNRTDLNLCEVVYMYIYISIIFQIPVSWLNLLHGY